MVITSGHVCMNILLVEPSRVGLIIVGRMLERRGDTVFPFQDGIEALAFLRDNPQIDVLITSFETRTICGLELCWDARILSESRGPLYVIVMSSTRERAKLVEALDSGADDFIQKPPAEEELAARLRAAARLIRSQKEVRRLALTDPLTGAYNRRYFFDSFRAAVEDESIRDLSLVTLDIDHFKSINDRYGHDVGDLAICQVAGMFANEEGVFGRIGGEEFAWMLPHRSEFEAVEKAETIRRAIKAMTIVTERSSVSLTCSFGVATREPGETMTEISKRADLALYAAKSGGRNCVGIASALETFRRSA